MAETDTAAHRSKKDAAIDSLCAYRDGSEKHIGLLFEAIGSFEVYLAENGMQIPEIASENRTRYYFSNQTYSYHCFNFVKFSFKY